MHKLEGSCHCGNIEIEVALALAPDEYIPRACDCEFCRKHGASYISDPDGSLVIKVRDEKLLKKYHQGSGTAEMLICANCGVLIGGVYRAEGCMFAAINTKTIDGNTTFGESQPVSPKTLSSEEKVIRWRKLWFSNVNIIAP